MKKFGLCVLSIALLSFSVQATPETAPSVQSAFSSFVGSLKNAVQAQGQVLKFQVQRQQQIVTDLIKKYSNESIAQAQNNLENAKVVAKAAVNYASENPKEAANLVKDFVLNNSKALAGTALTAYITYKILRAFTDLKPGKYQKGFFGQPQKDGIIKSAAKKTAAGVLSAAAAVLAWNKLVV